MAETKNDTSRLYDAAKRGRVEFSIIFFREGKAMLGPFTGEIPKWETLQRVDDQDMLVLDAMGAPLPPQVKAVVAQQRQKMTPLKFFPRDASADAASGEIGEFTKNLEKSTNPEEQKAAKALQDFLASVPEQQGLLWEEDNLGWDTDKTLEYSHEISAKPPFYSGSMPLEYTEGKSPGGVLFFHDFGDFRNQFKLDRSFIVMGARTVDKNGKLLAEARVRYYVGGNTQGRELEEFHYDEAGRVFSNAKVKLTRTVDSKLHKATLVDGRLETTTFCGPPDDKYCALRAARSYRTCRGSARVTRM